MDNQTLQELTTVIGNLAEKIGTTAESFWPVWVRYTFATHLALFLVNMIAAVLCTIIVITCIVLFRSHWREASAKEDAGKEGWGNNSPSRHSIVCIVTAVVGIIAFIVDTSTFGYAFGQIPALFVPEAQAVADLLALAKASK